MADLIKETKEKMNAALEHFKKELRSIRTGRANPEILDNVTVEVYGSAMRLRDMATISVPEPRQILITPFDATNCGAIAKGIEKANLGLPPRIDGKAVRIQIPDMTTERRQEMKDVVHRKREDCKVAIRNHRRDSNELARRQKSDGLIAEDVMKKLEKGIQELTDKSCKEADTIAEQKEKEISTI
ncbi:MAG: rrf [Chlamydiales bacterium]|jgi:ribosome recycling factor|nr:rrf [Chlamydiales bacterium]